MNKPTHPPKLLLRFFRWFCHPDLLPYIEGDLIELFEERVREKGVRKARWLFAWDVLKLFRRGIIRPSGGTYRLNNYGLLRNYFKVAYRHLLRNRSFSLINIFGLVTGITTCLIILQYVGFEHSYDDFHADASDIYRVTIDDHNQNARKTTLTPPPLGPVLQKDFPEIIHFTRLILPWSGQAATSTLGWQTQEGKDIKHSFQWGFYTDPGFLKMFSFSLIIGDRETALAGLNQVVLSESTARKLFGTDWAENDSIIGQHLEYVNEFDRFTLTITGIIADTPENSHFQYDFLASFATLSTGWGKEYAETWDGNGVYTYLQLAPYTHVDAFHNKLNDYVHQITESNIVENAGLLLQPLQDLYLHSHLEKELKANGNATYLSFLSILAVLILLIALINYINLSTNKAVSRGHEVGMRKVMGAFRPQLIKQFLFESLLLNGFAFLLAIVLFYLVMPFFTQLIGKSFYAVDGRFWLFILLLFLFTSTLSGLYPALVLSDYAPIQVLKGKLKYSPKRNQLQKAMVVFQFSATICLMLFTFTIYRQLDYMQNQETGFNKEGVIVVNGPDNRTETWIEHDRQKDQRKERDVFKDAVSQYTGVKAVSLSWSVPGERSSIDEIALGEAYNSGGIDAITVDNDYMDVYGLELLAGRFNIDNGVVINESAAKILGFRDPAEAIGKGFRDDRNYLRTIHGVVKDYHHHSLQYAIRPIMFKRNDPTYKLDSYYSLKVDMNQLNTVLEKVRAAYEKAYPLESFEFYFIDAYFDAQYRMDRRFGVLLGLFSGLTIFIACLGLFGLSLYTVGAKTKEIGIRKVLGGSVPSIVALLVRNTLLLIFIACILAFPISYWSAESWLSDYAYRIDLNWVFAMPIVITPVIVLLTIGYQTISAAMANPVESLRDE